MGIVIAVGTENIKKHIYDIESVSRMQLCGKYIYVCSYMYKFIKSQRLIVIALSINDIQAC